MKSSSRIPLVASALLFAVALAPKSHAGGPDLREEVETLRRDNAALADKLDALEDRAVLAVAPSAKPGAKPRLGRTKPGSAKPKSKPKSKKGGSTPPSNNNGAGNKTKTTADAAAEFRDKVREVMKHEIDRLEAEVDGLEAEIARLEKDHLDHTHRKTVGKTVWMLPHELEACDHCVIHAQDLNTHATQSSMREAGPVYDPTID